MMEKNGMLTLTESEYNMYKKGEVSERLQKEWELSSVSELDGIIKSGSFQLIPSAENT